MLILFLVIPAKAGIHVATGAMDPGFRRGDGEEKDAPATRPGSRIAGKRLAAGERARE